MVNASVSLHQLRTGQRAVIDYVTGRSEQVQRLAELGLRNGIEVEVFRAGNPCIFRTSGSKLCIRSDRSLNIFVRPSAE